MQMFPFWAILEISNHYPPASQVTRVTATEWGTFRVANVKGECRQSPSVHAPSPLKQPEAPGTNSVQTCPNTS